ncbi:hypothetical protein [Crossiella cryophila]|uniref:hypothetical protein n=1 Tax=Crossiella cryophila TaxID=43355 RepID=UPI0031F1773E
MLDLGHDGVNHRRHQGLSGGEPAVHGRAGHSGGVGDLPHCGRWIRAQQTVGHAQERVVGAFRIRA